MSQENVELLRRGYEAFNRQDFEAWLDFLDPQVEFREMVLTPDAATYHGREAVRAWLKSGQDAFAAVEFRIERTIDGGDAVVAAVWVHGRGVGSGAEFETRIAHASRWWNGRAVFVAAYPELRQALEAVGLEERAIAQENVQTLRQGLDAFFRRDRQAWLALCDPDFETVPSDDWPELDPIRGAAAAWEFYVQTDESWEETPYEYVHDLDAGDDKIVGQMRREMRGKASGASVVYSYWVVATFRGDRVRRIEWFAERADALEAAGLSE